MYRQFRSTLLSKTGSLLVISFSGVISTSSLLLANGIIIDRAICVDEESHGSKCELQTKTNGPPVTKKGESWYCSNYHIPLICASTSKISEQCQVLDPVAGQCEVKLDRWDGSVLKDTADNDVKCAGSPAQCKTL